MKKTLISSGVICLLAVSWLVAGSVGDAMAQCQRTCGAAATCTAAAKVKECKLALCGDCGEIKDSAKCCDPKAEKCDHCGLTKGSPGCCTIEPGKTAELCSQCGEIKGGKKCCVADAPKCDKCGFNKGAPGCCAMPAEDAKTASAAGKCNG